MIRTRNISKMLLFGLIIFITSRATPQELDKRLPEGVSTKKYYLTHILTNYASKLGLIAGLFVSLEASDIGAQWAARKFGIISRPYLYVYNNSLINGIFFIPVLTSIIASLAVIYKTPQWTDRMLKINTKRTKKQNIIGFLVRLLLPSPLDALLGEYLILNKSSSEDSQSTIDSSS